MIKVKRKPRKCPVCRGKVVQIIYGEPTKEDFIAAQNGRLCLGGITMEPNSPDWQCTQCKELFLKVSN